MKTETQNEIYESLRSRTVESTHRYSGKQGKWGYWCDPFFRMWWEIEDIPYIDESMEQTLASYGVK
jgi:hypothetical protein